MRTGMYTLVFCLLFTGFFLLFRKIRMLEQMERLLRKTWSEMDEAARRRSLQDRQKLVQLRQENTIWTVLERELNYTGLRLMFPRLTAEILIVCNLLACGCVAVLLFTKVSLIAGLVGPILLCGAEKAVFRLMRVINLRRVNEHLMRFLDFLGNYSITAGEVTGVLYQVSRYMEEPIKSALESCYYEAQLTGDTGLALLSMAEKIEHPQFKEIARNMEVSIRYCADFTALVTGSKRSLREYLEAAQEKRGMLREAVIDMVLLAVMSVVILAVVGSLVQMPVAKMLTETLPGRIGLCVLAVTGILFLGQIQQAD